jgi:hypothetical protein
MHTDCGPGCIIANGSRRLIGVRFDGCNIAVHHYVLIDGHYRRSLTIVEIFDCQRENRQYNASEYDDKDTANVLNRNSVRFVLLVGTILLVRIVIPPGFLERFELTLVE